MVWEELCGPNFGVSNFNCAIVAWQPRSKIGCDSLRQRGKEQTLTADLYAMVGRERGRSCIGVDGARNMRGGVDIFR